MPTILEHILGEFGETERVGSETNHRVLEYLRTCGLKPGDPWCGALLAWAAIQAGVTPPEHPEVARSWLTIGEPVLTPSVGDIVVLRRGTGWQGHCALFVRYTDHGRIVLALGGNQSDRVCIAPFDATKVLGYRRLTRNLS